MTEQELHKLNGLGRNEIGFRRIGIAGSWCYLIRPPDRAGLFAIVRRDLERDVLEDEIALCYSEEVAEVMATALLAHKRRQDIRDWSVVAGPHGARQ